MHWSSYKDFFSKRKIHPILLANRRRFFFIPTAKIIKMSSNFFNGKNENEIQIFGFNLKYNNACFQSTIHKLKYLQTAYITTRVLQLYLGSCLLLGMYLSLNKNKSEKRSEETRLPTLRNCFAYVNEIYILL